ncbi:MAG: ATP-binding protein [Gemmatimonadaceae bacterium]|nr:ATP-binding protein [Gemmatimonadaceae bacterium]
MIVRPHIVEQLKRSLSPGSLCVIKGEIGVGKSTFCKELLSSIESAIFVEVSPDTIYGYDQDHFAEKLGREYSRVSGMPYTLEDEATPITSLPRHLRAVIRSLKKDQLLHVIVDGIADIAESSTTAARQLLQLIPSGEKSVCAVLAGGATAIPFGNNAQSRVEVFTLPALSQQEAANLIADSGVHSDFLDTIQRIGQGNPGKLSSLCRLVLGASSSTASVPSGNSLAELYRTELDAVQSLDQSIRLALAILASDATFSDLAALKKVANLHSEFEATLQGLSFLTISHEKAAYINQSIRIAAQHYFGELREEALRAITRYYEEHPDADVALGRLAKLLQQQGESEKIIVHLSNDQISAAVQRAASTTVLLDATLVGVDAARSLGREFDTCRLAIASTALRSAVTDASVLKRARALAWLDRVDEALILARSIPILELRIEVFCAVLAAIAERADVVDEALVAELDRDIGILKPGAFGDRAGELGAQLLRVSASSAIEMIRRSVGEDQTGTRLDLTFVRLAIAGARKPGAGAGSLELAANNVQDPTLRTLLASSANALEGASALAVIEHTRTLDRTDERMFLLESWMRSNSSRSGAMQVLRHALDEGKKSGGYNVNALSLYALAEALLFEKSRQSVSTFINEIDQLKPAAKANSPATDLVALECRLARAEVHSGDADAAYKRIASVADSVQRQSSLVDQLAGLSLVVSTLASSDEIRFFDKDLDLESYCVLQIEALSRSLLEDTADHYEVFGPACRVLARRRPDLARKLAGSLNLSFRRNACLRDIVRNHTRMPIASWSLEELRAALTEIEDVVYRDSAVEVTLAAVSGQALNHCSDELLSLLEFAATSSSAPHIRSKAYAQLACLDFPLKEEFRKLSIARCNEALAQIASPSDRCSAIYSIVPILARFSKSDADVAFGVADSLRRQHPVEDVEEDSGILSLELAIRCLQATADEYPSRMVNEVCQQVHLVASSPARARLWSLLSGAVRKAGYPQEALSLATSYLIPLLSTESRADLLSHYETLVHAAPSLWREARSTLQIHLDTLPDSLHTRIVSRLADYVAWPVFDGDPIDPIVRGTPRLEYTQVCDLLLLAALSRDDAMTANISRRIFSASQRAKASLTRTQLTYIGAELCRLALRFPVENGGIQHEGWRIVIESLGRKIKGEANDAYKREILERARKLPNRADIPFVLTHIAVDVSSAKERDVLIDEIMDRCSKLTFAGDAIDRFLYLAESLAAESSPSTKRVYGRLATFVKESTIAEDERREHRIVQSAYAFDQELGAQVASVLDSDLSKRTSRDEGDFRSAKSKYNARDAGFAQALAADDVEQICEALLGSLSGSRISFARSELRVELLRHAASLPTRDAYWTMSFVIESAVAESKATRGALHTAATMFDACLRGARVSESLRRRVGNRGKTMQDPEVTSAGEVSNLVVSAVHEIAKAEAKLFAWLQSVGSEPIIIVDPFFKPDDLGYVVKARQNCPDAPIRILTGLQQGYSFENASAFKEALMVQWRRFSAEPAQDIIVAVYMTEASRKCPFHDRWWLSTNSGMRLGTSSSGIGNRIAEISELADNELRNLQDNCLPYSRLEARFFQDERLLRQIISLE